jgi:ERCC4-related helicase
MSNFITNSGTENLKKRLSELIDKSDELKFLVGFFYFSGIRELFQAITENPKLILNVLVGLNVDNRVYGLSEYADSKEKLLTESEKRDNFLKSLKFALESEEADIKDFDEQVFRFVKMLEENRLKIKKTREPNHAKLYIFRLNENIKSVKDQIFITGSSNFTHAGLSGQNEFNIEVSDYGQKEALKYFDDLWEDATLITEDEITKNRIIDLIKNRSPFKEISPFEAFAVALKSYVESFEQKDADSSIKDILENAGYVSYKYQIDAIKQSISIIEKEDGVLIADVVGLGKTVIACAVGSFLNKKGLIICPPGLTGDENQTTGWEKYLNDFKLDKWKVRSLGDLESILDYLNNAGKGIEVIVIDEAHRFRNENTQNYELLKNICRNKKVILLTATPFNNKPADILSLLSLFTVQKKSNLVIDGNLKNKFKLFGNEYEKLAFINKYCKSKDKDKKQKAEKYYEFLFNGKKDIDLKKVEEGTHKLARGIKGTIEPVTIRRNRLDLKNDPNYKDEVKNLSEVSDPKTWFYELTKEQSTFFDKVVKVYFADIFSGGQFTGAIYMPFFYEAGKSPDQDDLSMEDNRDFLIQKNLYDFMRRLLVKRFESSFGSFRQSIENFQRITKTVLTFIKNSGGGDLYKGKYILNRKLIEDVCDSSIEEIENKMDEYICKAIEEKNPNPKKYKKYEISEFKQKEKFIKDIENDLLLFEKILNELKELGLEKNDSKADSLVIEINKILTENQKEGEPKRKVIIFSEYADTVKHLSETLKDKFKNKILVVDGSLPEYLIKNINENFDASIKEENQKDEYDILLSTDKISEGFNLNRAGIVVNYDIPWNPVRVIQRVGRINRISKKVFEQLYIANFFPTEKASEYVKVEEIAKTKMFMIHSALGEDSKIFHIDEKPEQAKLYERINTNPEKLEEGEESFYTKAKIKFDEIKKENPGLINQLSDYPTKIKTYKNGKENELLVIFKKSRIFVSRVAYDKDGLCEPLQIPFEEAYAKIICDKNEKRLSQSKHFWNYYEKSKNIKEKEFAGAETQNIETKALNNLKTIRNNGGELFNDFYKFILSLIEDIEKYGTLPEYTLRTIAKLKINSDVEKKEALKELENLSLNIGGENYLEKIKSKPDLKRELIVAIENQNANLF